MRALPLLLVALVLTGCTQAREQVRVAPAMAVVDAAPASSARNPPIGGVVLPADRPIGTGVAAAPALAALARAITAAGLAEELNGPGPFTLFAPSDEAFGRLAPGTAAALLKPENRASLTKLLRLHLVPARLTTAELVRRVAVGGGRTTLTTVAGEAITVNMTGAIVTLTDVGGDKSYIETADVRQSNGVLHVVNGVLVPRL